jgi:hypothetical protein
MDSTLIGILVIYPRQLPDLSYRIEHQHNDYSVEELSIWASEC